MISAYNDQFTKQLDEYNSLDNEEKKLLQITPSQILQANGSLPQKILKNYIGQVPMQPIESEDNYKVLSINVF